MDGDGALPSRRIAAPLKGTKLGSAASGSDVLSAQHHDSIRKIAVKMRMSLGAM